MCMFAAQASVRGTQIFASRIGSRQVLVYSAKVETPDRNAMMLPVPVAAGGAPIELIDLSAYPRFFEDLTSYFIAPPPAFGGPQARLEVFQVGSFEVSIVPTLGDMSRLDERFNLSPTLRATLAERYADHAFVVYQFAPGKQLLHPFGFSFESRYARHLFYPTVHVHDGVGAPPGADFAHTFYAQGAKLVERHLPPHLRGGAGGAAHQQGWDPGPGAYGFAPPAPGTPMGPRFPPFIQPEAPLDHGALFGTYANIDVFVQLAS